MFAFPSWLKHGFRWFKERKKFMIYVILFHVILHYFLTNFLYLSLQLPLPPNYIYFHMWHLSCDKELWKWKRYDHGKKQVWFLLININWHICTPLEFIIVRAKSSENSNNVVSIFFYHLHNVTLHRSSHMRCSVRKGALKNYAKFTGKHLCKFQACL